MSSVLIGLLIVGGIGLMYAIYYYATRPAAPVVEDDEDDFQPQNYQPPMIEPPTRFFGHPVQFGGRTYYRRADDSIFYDDSGNVITNMLLLVELADLISAANAPPVQEIVGETVARETVAQETGAETVAQTVAQETVLADVAVDEADAADAGNNDVATGDSVTSDTSSSE